MQRSQHRFYISVFLLIMLSTFMWCLVLMHMVDRPIVQMAHMLDHTLWRKVLTIFTDLGLGWFILLFNVFLIGLAILFSKPIFYRRAFFSLIAVAAAGIGVNVLKFIFGRPRPWLPRLPGENTFQWFHYFDNFNSFPSGHAAIMGAASLTFSYIFPTWRIPIFVLGILVAMSRVLLHVHYLSDVVMGYAFGCSLAWMLKGLMHAYFDEDGL